jgi:hypothetical protein
LHSQQASLVSISNEDEFSMAHRILEPFVRMVGRWRTARAVAFLDRHLLEDAGIKIDRTPWDDLNITQSGYWSGRQRKRWKR